MKHPVTFDDTRRIQDAKMTLASSLNFMKPVIEAPSAKALFFHLDDHRNPNEPMLWWQETPGGLILKTHDNSDCLSQFIRLGKATNDEIHSFASRYGVLGLWPICRDENQTRWMGDSVDLYRRLASHSRAVLLTAARLYNKESVPRELWKEIHTSKKLPQTPASRLGPFDIETEVSVSDQIWQGLVMAAQLWASSSPLFLQLYWAGSSPQVRLTDDVTLQSWNEADYARSTKDRWQFKDVRDKNTFFAFRPRRSRLFSNLTVQLIAALASPLFICDVCGNPFEAEHRKPHLNRAKLCDNSECKTVRARERAQESYKKRKLREEAHARMGSGL